MIKFQSDPADLTQINVVLTDFGMAESDSKGGTPVFASPECFEKKDKKSDVFSFGRVIAFLLLRKEQFMEWLFVPIRSVPVPVHSQLINLVVQMTTMTDRLDLYICRIIFDELRRNGQLKPKQNLIDSFDTVVKANYNDFGDFISELCEFR